MNRSVEDWSLIVSRISETDLETTGSALDWISSISTSGRADSAIIARELVKNAESLQHSISDADGENWHELKSIAFAIERDDTDVIDVISPALSHERCAELLMRTNPRYYDTIVWFMVSMNRLAPGWPEKVGASIVFEKLSLQFASIRKGDLRPFFELRSLLRKLKVQVKRSDLLRIRDGIRGALSEANVSDLSVGFGEDLTYCQFFPQDYVDIFGVIDTADWARQIENSNPRDWRQLVTLMHMDVGNTLVEVNEKISQDTMSNNVKAKCKGNEYEMRCLLWFLALSSEQKRNEYVSNLREEIRDSFALYEAERYYLFTFLQKYDPDTADALAAEFSYSHKPDSDEKCSEESEEAKNQLREIRKQFAQMDEKGIDYVVRYDRIFSDDETGLPYYECIES